MSNIPQLTSQWRNHCTNQVYRVTEVANTHKTDRARFPIWICLTTGDGNIEARTISYFLDNFSEAIGD